MVTLTAMSAAGRQSIISREKSSGKFFSNVFGEDGDVWETGNFDDEESALKSRLIRQPIMDETCAKKPRGRETVWVTIGNHTWIAHNTTSSFTKIQEDALSSLIPKPQKCDYMFLNEELATRPFLNTYMNYFWNYSFDGNPENEREEEERTKMGKSQFYKGVYYNHSKKGWVFNICVDSYVFTSSTLYRSMFLAWIERELFLIQLHLEKNEGESKYTEFKKGEAVDKQKMLEFFYSLGGSDGDRKLNAFQYFDQLYLTGDPRVTL